MGSVARKVTRAVGDVTSSVLGLEKPESPQGVETPPKVEAPAVMPSPNDDAVRAAKRKSVAEQRRRGGRQSTILTTLDQEKLGG